MHYTINVSRNGQHLFATAPHCAANPYAAAIVIKEISTRFPANEGFKVSATRWEESGKEVFSNTPEEMLSLDAFGVVGWLKKELGAV